MLEVSTSAAIRMSACFTLNINVVIVCSPNIDVSHQKAQNSQRMNSMTRQNFSFLLAVIAFRPSATLARLPDKQKVVAGADRAFEKFSKAYVGPAPGCAAAVSLNGDVVFEKAFGLADLELNVPNTTQTIL